MRRSAPRRPGRDETLGPPLPGPSTSDVGRTGGRLVTRRVYARHSGPRPLRSTLLITVPGEHESAP